MSDDSLQAQLRALIAEWREAKQVIGGEAKRWLQLNDQRYWREVACSLMCAHHIAEVEALLVSSPSGAQEPTQRS